MSSNLDKIGDSILYELLVYSEWIQEPEILLKLTKPQNKLLTLATRPWTLKFIIPYNRVETVNDKIARLISARLPWQFAVGEDGKVVAIIQDTLLEIRTSRDEYSSVVGRATISRDLFPQYRKAVWSPDCSLLACAFSSGRIGLYDLLGSNILNIEPRSHHPDEWPSTDEAIAGIVFLEDRVKSPKWSYELIAVDYKGNLRSFLVSPTEGFREHHTFSFTSYYRSGITAVHLIQPGNLLILAGPSDIQLEQKGRGSSAGLSAWRILSDHPFYSPALSSEEDLVSIQGSRGIWAWLPALRSSKQSDVLTMRVSPAGRLLACLHASGAISLWQLPSLRLFKHWHLAEQPDHNSHNPQLVDGLGEKISSTNAESSSLEFLPVDISWWSENALIIARYSGAVSVCSTTDLHNLLGEYPEFFAGQPQVSAASGDGRGFLSLECEVNVTSKETRLEDSTGEEQADETSSDEAEVGDSFLGRGTSAVRSALYWVTDSERFRPPRPKPRILKRTYRLLGLKSTTPEELYARKIDNEEYGEALQLARAYGLDCDLVYQRQWRSQKVSVASIHDYLSKINKRSWVLRECTERVPETATAAKELLLFGLQATSLQVLLSAGFQGSKDLCLMSQDSEEEKGRKEDKISDIVNQLKCSDLSSEQKEILQCRHKLLKYLDMLSTYEIILGCSSEELYEDEFYARFRSQPVLQSVVEFARDGQWQAVSCMLTYHSKILLKHRLPIISSFPETMPPFEYRSLLPECEDDQVLAWPVDDLREQDWCEELSPSEVSEVDSNDFLYGAEDSNKGLLEFCREFLSPVLLCEWYIARATQLEARSKMVDHSLSLVTLGQERSIQGLEPLLAELLTLEVLVYEIQLEDLTLTTLRKHTHLSQAHLLLSKSTPESFVSDTRRWLMPHLSRCEQQNPGSKKKLLHDFLVGLSSSSLVLPLQIFKHFKIEHPGPFFSSIEEAVSVALDCLYTYPEADQLETAFEFLDCLPEKSFGEKNKKMLELHCQVDQLEGHLSGAEILSRYMDIGVPLYKLKQMGSDENAAFRTLVQVARSMTKRVPPPTQPLWSALLKDMLDLQAKVFNCILLEKCFEIYAETLLASGSRPNIRYAGSIMECSRADGQDMGQQKIRYEVSVKLVLSASREYFDSAGNLSDPNMELSKACLLLITDEHPEIKEELDLISSLQLLNDFGVKMLPIQVRLCSNKLRLLKDCVKAKPLAYRSTQRLLQLANFLRIEGEDGRAREAAVLVLVAEAALKAKDYTFSAETCHKMMERSHSVGWQVARELAECNEYQDIESRHKLLAFAILHCEPSAIEQLITYRCKLEARILHEKISSKVADGATGVLTAASPTYEDFCDALSSPEVERKEFLSPMALPQIIQQSAEALRDSTRNVLLNVGNETFWRSAFNWLPQPKEQIKSEYGDPVLTQGFHAFYIGLHESEECRCHESALGPSYDSYAVPSEPTLDLLLALVRVALLEEADAADSKAESEEVALTDDVLLKAGRGLLMDDCQLGLSLLLSLRDASLAQELFLQLPRSIVTLQLAAYYFALRVCMEEIPAGDLESRHNIFLCNPNKLSLQVHHGTIIEGGTITEKSKEYRRLLASFISLQSEFMQTLQLQSHDCGVDPLRFSNDEQYRHDSIIGLAMTENEDQFLLAQSFAERYGVSPSELAVARLSHLLLNEPTQDKIAAVVTELEQFLDVDVFERMEKEVLPHISGSDHQRLVCFFSALQKISDPTLIFSLPPSQHIKLLKKVKATSHDIDYKILVSQPDEILSMLRPVLSQDNVSMVAKLLKSLPPSLHCTVQTGELFKTWMHKLFFEVSKKASEEQWMAKFELCKDQLPKLSPQDLTSLASDIAFSEAAFNHIPRSCRLAILEEVLKFCRSRQQIEDWGEMNSQLQQWTSHLAQFTIAPSEAVLITPKCRDLARFLELSKGEESLVLRLREDAVQSDVPFSTLEYLFSLQSSSYPPLNQYLLEKLQEAKENNRPELLSSVLKRLSQSSDQAPQGKINSLRGLHKQLEPLCADVNLEPSTRLQALRLMQLAGGSSSDETDSVTNRALYTTQAVLASTWSDNPEIEVCQLEEPEARSKLFESLLEQSDTWEKLIALSEVLRAWTTAKMECSDLWIELIQRMTSDSECKEDELGERLQDIFKSGSFSSETLLELIKPLKNIRLKLLLCLRTSNDALYLEAIQILQRQDSVTLSSLMDGELVDLLVTCDLVVRLVPTAAYPHMVATLLAQQDGDSETSNLNPVLRQLVRGGLIPEAATLYAHSIRLSASLASFSSVMKIFPLQDFSP